MSRWRRLALGLLLLLLLVLSVPLALLAAAASDSGSRWLLQRATEVLATQDVRLTIGHSEGRLLGRLRLSGIAFEAAGTRAALDHLLLDWRPRALLARRLHIRLLEVADLDLVPPPADEAAAPAPPQLPDLVLPLVVQLDRLQAQRLRIGAADEALTVDRVALGATLDRDGIRIRGLDVALPGVSASGRLAMQAGAPHGLDGDLAVDLDPALTGEQVGPVAARAVLAGPALAPRIDLRLAAPATLQVQGSLQLDRPQPAFDLRATWPGLAWPLQGTPQVLVDAGDLRLAGAVDDYRLALQTRLRGDGIPPAELDLAAHGGLQGLVVEQLELGVLGGRVQIGGDLQWQDAVRWAFSLQLEQLDPSGLVAELPGRLDGRLTVSGRHSAAQGLTLQAEVHELGGRLRDQPLGLRGRFELEGGRLRAEGVQLDALSGRLLAAGGVDLQGGPSWAFDLRAEGLDPGAYLADWPGRLDGRISLSGQVSADAGPQLQAEIREIQGRLRGQPVAARGRLNYRPGVVQVEALEVSSGRNRVALDGRAGDRLDLGFSIEAPELAALYPGLDGTLQGAGRLGGSPQRPALKADIDGRALTYQGFALQALEVQIDWREAGGDGGLRVAGLALGETRVESLSAQLSGTPEAHRLELTAKGPQAELAVSAQGGWEEPRWTGTLQQLDIAAPPMGQWQLGTPVALSVGQDGGRSEALCLRQGGAALCAEGSWQHAGALDLHGRLTGFELSSLAALMPGEAVVDGLLQGEFELAGTAASPRLAFRLQPADGVLRLDQGDEPLEVEYRNARIDGRFADDRGEADLALEVGGNGVARGRLALGAVHAGERDLAGAIDVDFPDLALVSGFVPALERITGRLHLDLDLDGTLAAPRVQGAVRVIQASARVPDAGITLEDVSLAATGDGRGPWQITGRLRSDPGQLALDGTVDIADPARPGVELTLRGDNLQAVRLPDVRVWVSPDLRLEGRGPYHLSGVLRIPEAAIEVKQLPPSTIDVSADEIIVGEDAPAAVPTGPQNLTARVRLELGDKVTLKGFGLDTGLTGAIVAAVDSQGPVVDGKIELRDGRYKAYGQDLTVERGRLLFAGPPGNPQVDLRAVRVSRDGNVKAYLAIDGPLARPRPRVYSEPALPEAEAVAYLVTGNGLEGADRQQGADITGAALSLGLSQTEPLLQDLSQRVGLDDVRVEGGLQDGSLILGKYLNPDLYLGYSQNLFNPEGAVLLRLRLNDRIDVESRSGNEQSVDLFYRIEHD